MTIISMGFSSKTQILLSRQNYEITKQEVDTTLFNFIKHLNLQRGDHTYFEFNNHRYIYQPIEALYVFIITTQNSNVIEDLEVVKMLSQIAQTVTKQCVTEKTIMDNIFDLIFYMDEIVIDGNREALTMEQLETFIAMESHEEKLQLMLMKNKEREEKERRRQIAMRLDKEKQRKKLDTYFTTVPTHNVPMPIQTTNVMERYVEQTENVFSMPMETSYTGGMQLTKSKQSKKLTDLALETGFNLQAVMAEDYNKRQHIPVPQVTKIASDVPLLVQVEEKCSGLMDIERDVIKLAYQGSLILTVYDSEIASFASLQLEIGDNCKFKPKYHPNLDKSKIPDGILELKDDNCPFRLNSPISLVKWKHDTNESVMPFSVSCWSSCDSLETSLSVEVTNQDQTELSNVALEFDCPRTVKTNITNSQDVKIYHENDVMYWDLGTIPKNESKSIGFSVRMDLDSLVPFTFTAETFVNYFNIKVKNCFDKNGAGDINHRVVHKTCYNIKVDQTT